jgi:hypothetical protein
MTKKTETKNDNAPPEDKPKNDDMDTNETKDKEDKKDTSAEVANGQGNTAELEESQSSNKSDD